MKYRPEIDGLRAMAVVPVIFFHAGFSLFSGGFVGVDIFFVISGYLNTTIILSEMIEGNFSIVNFYERRARRILPALFFVILCCLPFAWAWLLPRHFKDFSQSLSAVSVFSSNILFWLESGYFGAASELKPLLHTWSLAVEEQYYVLFPLLLIILWQLRKRWIFATLLTIGIVSLLLSHWGAYHSPSETFYLLHTRAWELAIGALVAFYFIYNKAQIEAIRSQKNTAEILGLLGFILILYSVFAFDKNTPFPSFYALVPTIGTALIIIFVTPETVVGRLLASKPIVGIGLISYSAYLWHQPLFVFAKHRTVAEPSVGYLIILSVLSILLAYCSWRYIEAPFRNKRRFSRKVVFIFSCLGSLILFSIGVLGHLSNGYPQRFDKKLVAITGADHGLVLGCEEEPIATHGFTCVVGNKQVKPDIALLGDSHSPRLTKALSDTLAEQDRSLVVYSQSWGVPFLDVGTDKPGRARKNREFMMNALNAVSASDHIKTVILFAEWSNYTKGYRGKPAKSPAFYTDKQSQEKSLQENQQVFQRGLRRTVELLANAGKDIIVIGSVPEYEVHLPEMVAKNLLFNDSYALPDQYVVTIDKYQERNQEAIHAFAKMRGKYQFIDPSKLFCDDICSYINSNQDILYTDENHISYQGAKILVKELRKFL